MRYDGCSLTSYGQALVLQVSVLKCTVFFPVLLLGVAHTAVAQAAKEGASAICRDGASNAKAIPIPSFADENLELLALQLTRGLLADRVTYERLRADLSKIKSTELLVKDVRYRAKIDPHILNVYFTDPGDLHRAKNGSFTQWNCLNSFFHVSVQEHPRFGAIVLNLPGVYNPKIVVELYESISGIQHAEFDGLIGDGSNVYVTRNDSTWVYLLDFAGGDCLSGCTEREFFLFEVNKGSRISRRETWKSVNGAEPPAWVTTYYRRYQ